MEWVTSEDEEARARLEMVLSDDGLIMTHDGSRPLGSSGLSAAAAKDGGGVEDQGGGRDDEEEHGGALSADAHAIFVMDRTGTILLTTDHSPQQPARSCRFSHASLVAGAPVIAAGAMRIRSAQGKVSIAAR